MVVQTSREDLGTQTLRREEKEERCGGERYGRDTLYPSRTSQELGPNTVGLSEVGSSTFDVSKV